MKSLGKGLKKKEQPGQHQRTHAKRGFLRRFTTMLLGGLIGLFLIPVTVQTNVPSK